jgi:hypothetical protein
MKKLVPNRATLSDALIWPLCAILFVVGSQ